MFPPNFQQQRNEYHYACMYLVNQKLTEHHLIYPGDINTWNHRQLTRLTSQEITDQIMMTRAKIFEVTGVDCTIVRPPYGACNDNVQGVGITTGVSFINWSVDTLDWKNKNAQAIYNEIISTAKNGDIILCHDLHKTTVDAMELVIPKLIADGYQLVTVSELMKYSNTPLEAGKIYYMQ